MPPRFIHLRLHTEYSLSDGLLQIDRLTAQAAGLGMPALAITDHSNLFGTVKFWRAATKAGIKPLVGADLWLDNPQEPGRPFLFTVLCQNNQGYANLLKMISRCYRCGQAQDRVICQRSWLEDHGAGLLVLSGAHSGDIGRALLAESESEALAFLSFWQTFFPDRYYLEIRRTDQPEDEIHLAAAVAFAGKHGLPVVATNDVRFHGREDFDAHEARVCIHAGETLSNPHRKRHYTEVQYFRSPAEMATLFADLPEALQNTVEIAKRCTVSLTLGKPFLPRFPVPEGYTAESWLTQCALAGLARRARQDHISESAYHERLNTELDVINRMGFAGYFLIVADFTRWARSNDVPVGPGRGSGPGSLVAWATGITDLDPLAHELLFERFLNPERVSLPDFDIDFCMAGRDRVIEYVMQTHGEDRVAQIITYGTMAARAVLRDVGRVLGHPYGFVDRLAKLVPFELGMTLEKALQQEALLAQRYQDEEEVRTLIDLARKLEGITRNVGRHAGGIVIAPDPLTSFTPLYCEPGDTQHPVTQFDKDDVEAVGLVKFDFLGLRTLTIIDRTLKNIQKQDGAHPRIDINAIPVNDAATFDLLKNCLTTAVFQLESRGMKDLVRRLQPDCFEDIVALVALFRPGPLQSGMVEDFISRKHGRARVSYPHPALEPILRPTYGVIVYQEQVMQIAQVLAGYSLGAADILRRAMGKKKPEEMAIQREVFCRGATERGVSAATATHIFDLMEKFAGYGFNKSHSASYALIAWQTAWLKTHYPAAFMAAVLSSDMDHTDKVVLFMEECRTLNLHVALPDVNHSGHAFEVIDGKNLSFGLGAIKGLGETAIQTIVEARQKGGRFVSLADFCQRIDIKKVNRRALEALIRAGALDSIDTHRARIMATLEQALQQAEQTHRNTSRGQGDLLGNETVLHLPAAPGVAPWPEAVQLAGERETLGLYLSGHPLDRYRHELHQFVTAPLRDLHPQGSQNVILAGLIARLRVLQTRRGDRMAILTLEDGHARMEVICFSDLFQKNREWLTKDTPLIAEGEASTDEFSGGYRVVAAQLLSIEQAREKHARYLRITLPAATTHEANTMDRLAGLLQPFRGGSCAVRVDYIHQKARARLRLGDAWHVKPADALLEQLCAWLGPEGACMMYQ